MTSLGSPSLRERKTPRISEKMAKSNAKNLSLTKQRKQFIIEFRPRWLANSKDVGSTSRNEKNEAAQLQSAKWPTDLFVYLKSKDDQIRRDDVKRWIINHPWIKDPTQIPKGFTNAEYNKIVNTASAQIKKNTATTSSAAATSIQEKYLRPTVTVKSPQRSILQQVDETPDLDTLPAMPNLTPQTSPYTNRTNESDDAINRFNDDFLNEDEPRSPAMSRSRMPVKKRWGLTVTTEGLIPSFRQLFANENGENVSQTNMTGDTNNQSILSANQFSSSNFATRTSLVASYASNGTSYNQTFHNTEAPQIPSGQGQDWQPLLNNSNGFQGEQNPSNYIVYKRPKVGPPFENEAYDNAFSSGPRVQLDMSGTGYQPLNGQAQFNPIPPPIAGNWCTSPQQYAPAGLMPFAQYGKATSAGTAQGNHSRLKESVSVRKFIDLMDRVREHGLFSHNPWANAGNESRTIDPAKISFKVNYIINGMLTVCNEHGEGLFDTGRVNDKINTFKRAFNRIMRKILFPVSHKDSMIQNSVEMKREHFTERNEGCTTDDDETDDFLTNGNNFTLTIDESSNSNCDGEQYNLKQTAGIHGQQQQNQQEVMLNANYILPSSMINGQAGPASN